MDSIDYYDRYAVPYYEETVDFSMEEQLKRLWSCCLRVQMSLI